LGRAGAAAADCRCGGQDKYKHCEKRCAPIHEKPKQVSDRQSANKPAAASPCRATSGCEFRNGAVMP